MEQAYIRELMGFLDQNPTCFHVADTIAKELDAAGFTRLKEKDGWEVKNGGKYYVTRNDSSLIAFVIPEGGFSAFHIIASHGDSPVFKIKENPEIITEDHYTKLNIEKYGGMLMNPWFDRPLSVAGRVIAEEGGRAVSHLVNIDRDLLMIPSLAIHMDRKANDGQALNPQTDLLPVLGDGSAKGTFMKLIADAAGVKEEEILSHDLFLYCRQKAAVWGAGEEYLSSGRIDDQQCAFASLKGFLEAKEQKVASVYCMFDNEEVGSGTKQGAASTFLRDVLTRLNRSLGRSAEDYHRAVAQSFMISSDNAHAVHPNKGDKMDPTNRPYINEGIVIKFNANQKYTTDGVSGAVMKMLCKKAEVPFQVFLNRADLPGGSTLGNIANTQVSLNTVDIGLPQLAMHSCYETCGVKDTEYFVKAAKVFYESDVLV